MRCYSLKQREQIIIFTIMLSFMILFVPLARANQVGDEFIRGYATALVEYNFRTSIESFRVSEGIIYLKILNVSEVKQHEILQTFSGIQGVHRVEILHDDVTVREIDEETKRLDPESKPKLSIFLPDDHLFLPLIADPRWPHFSAAYQRYVDSDDLGNVGSTSFGESFVIYRFKGPWNSTMEFGIQAGVFAIFDLDAESLDLINADYLIGIPLVFRKGNFSNMTRIFHQSSHLGDEFLLRGRAEKRVNLSYEAANSIFSYNLPLGFRIYAGGGYIFHKEPSDLEPWSTLAGMEYRSEKTWLDGSLRPVAAIDLQKREESNWDTDTSIRAGVQFENPDFLNRKMQLLFEYYNGKSPNGQFYEESIKLYGLGLHFFFE